MKVRCLKLFVCICMAGFLEIGIGFGQTQEQGKNDRHEGGKRTEKAAVREGMLKRGDGSGMMSGEGGMSEAMLGRIINNPQAASELGLSEEQIKTMKNSLEDMKKKHEELEKQLKESGLEQAKLMTGESVDEGTVLTAVEKAGKIRTEIAKIRMQHMLLVKKTLKPEQVNKIREMVQNRMKQIRSEKGNGEGENLKDRIHERMKKHQTEEKKDDQPGSSEKPAGTVKMP